MLIDRIATEVMRRISEQESTETDAAGTLVLLASHLVGKSAALAALRQKFAGKIEIVPLGVSFECMAPDISVLRDADAQQLVEKAAASENIVLLAPKISQIENIAYGREEGITEETALRSLLWGKKVHMLLDFMQPRFKRGTFFEKIGDALDALVDMGVEITTYTCIPAGNPDALSLVTEREVAAAAAKGEARILCQKGAIITPAARDRAAELQIKIDG